MTGRRLANRRQFVSGLAASMISLPLAAAALEAQGGSETARTPASPAEPPSGTTPASAAGAASPAADSVPDHTNPQTLRAAPAQIRLKPHPALETRVLAFNGVVPGPLLRVRQGDALDVTLVNGLDEPLSLHIGGAGAGNALDGVAGLTGPATAPGGEQRIRFQANRAGVFWYRPMLIGQTSRQTERGLYGVLIVDEAEPPPWTKGVVRDLVMVLDDWSLDDAGKINADSTSASARAGMGRLGNWLTLNSAPPPEQITAAPGARLRLRLLNAANARTIPLHFDGLKTSVVGIDGSPSEVFHPLHDRLMLAPGGRYDLVVEAPAAGSVGHVMAALGAGMPLLTLRAEGPAVAAQPEITPLPAPDLPAAIRLQDAVREKLTLAGPARPANGKQPDPSRLWTINNVAWPDAMAKPLFQVKSGTPVTLEIRNSGDTMQTLRLHGHQARRLHNLDDGWEPYWIDIIAVPPGHPTRISFVAGAPGKWLIGSAIAEKLDGGMAAWFEVTP